MKKLISFAIVFMMLFAFIGCEELPAPKPTVQDTLKKESVNIAENQKSLVTAQPAPTLKWSNERENIKKRVMRFNDPNKLGYIYLFSGVGTVLAYSVVKGKVTCVSSYMVPDENVISFPSSSGGYGGHEPVVVQQPDLDGSYGTNGDDIFWFDENDVMRQWRGDYLYSDEPIKIFNVPLMVSSKK